VIDDKIMGIHLMNNGALQRTDATLPRPSLQNAVNIHVAPAPPGGNPLTAEIDILGLILSDKPGSQQADQMHRRAAARGDPIPEIAQPVQPAGRSVARNEASIDGTDRRADDPVRLDPRLMPPLEDPGVISANGAATLKDQDDLPIAAIPSQLSAFLASRKSSGFPSVTSLHDRRWSSRYEMHGDYRFNTQQLWLGLPAMVGQSAGATAESGAGRLSDRSPSDRGVPPSAQACSQ
jgi:hypothetical protein